MNRIVTLASALLLGAGPALAEPTIGIGLSIGIGGGTPDIGLSGHIWSNDDEDEFAVGVGGAYYFGSQTFGADASVGYVFDGGVLGAGYDFLNSRPVLSLERADTDDGSEAMEAADTGGEEGPGEGEEGDGEIVLINICESDNPPSFCF